jgi:hypothetical protein
MAAKKPKTAKLTPAKRGQKPVTFKPGGLHQSLGVPQGKPIPPGKMAAAAAGKMGPKAARQASFAQNVLAKGQKTASANRRGKTSRSKPSSRGK